MMYRNFDTNELFTEEEVKNLYEQFKDEIPDYDSFEDYIEDMLSKGRRKEGGLVVANWYAVMTDNNDSDWGTGSYDLEEAKAMARNYGKEAFIAVIEEGNDPVCIEEIRDIEEEKELFNSFDSDISFTDVEEARNYFMQDETAEWFGEEEKQFNDELEACETLDDVAEVLNSYKDTIGNGSQFEVR